MSVFTCTCTCDAVLEASCSYMGPRWLIYILSHPIRKPFGYRRSIANVQVAETKETIGNRNYLHQCTRLLVAIPRSFRVSRLLSRKSQKTGVNVYSAWVWCPSWNGFGSASTLRSRPLPFISMETPCNWWIVAEKIYEDRPVTVRHMRGRPRKGPRYDDRSSWV